MKKVADRLRRIVSLAVVVGLAAFSWEAQAADWYSTGEAINNVANWTNSQGEACSAFNAQDTYWLARTADGQGYAGFSGIANLCLGAPTKSPAGFATGRLNCNFQNKILTVSNLTWFNGELRATIKKQSWFAGNVALIREKDGVCHRMFLSNNQAAIGMDSNLTAVDPRTVLHIGGNSTVTTDKSVASTYELMKAGFFTGGIYFTLRGKNAGFRGSFSVESPYQTVWLGGTEALGDPETPNAAALTLCDNASIGFQTSVKQSSTRGIRLDGEQAYLVAFSGQAETTGFTCSYPISKSADVTGRLVKDGSGSVTLDCAYTAGPIRVAEGTLVLGEHATFPAGQQLIICDGASVISHVSTAGFSVSYEGTGTGTLSYKDGYRQGASSLERRVSIAVEGPGSLDAETEVWVPVDGTTTLTATPADGKVFLHWKGAVGAIRDRAVYSSAVTLQHFVSDEALVAVFGDAPTALADFTDADGTTFAFADHVMTITVPSGVTNAYDYATLLSSGYVQEIVKSGAGALRLAAVPNYVGDFTILAGYAILSADGVLGAPDVGTVDVRSGAAIWVGTSAVVASGKLVKLAGVGLGSDTTVWGVLRGVVDNALGIQGTFDLTDSATVVAVDGAKFFTGSTIRMNGYVLTARTLAQWQTIDIRNAEFANSSDTVAQLKFAGRSTKFYTSDCRFVGLGEISVGNDCRCHIFGGSASSWPLVAGYQISLASTKNQEPSQTTMKWTGGASIPDGNMLKVGSKGVAKDSVVGFDGPISGLGTLSLDGGWLHWYSSESSFSGNFHAKADSANTLRTTLFLHDGSVFRCKNVLQFTDADLRLADATAFDLQAIRSVANDMSIVGGATGDSTCGRPTIAAIDFAATADGLGTLFMDSPVAVTGRTHVARGTLRLGASTVPYLPYASERLPVFSYLAFEDGTVFDLNGNDLEFAELSGFPTVQNAGALTLTGSLKLTADDVTAGRGWDFGEASFTFASEAKIVIDDSLAKPNRKTRYTVLTAAGGISGVPTVQNVVRSSNWIAEIDSTGKNLDLVYQPKGLVISVR